MSSEQPSESQRILGDKEQLPECLSLRVPRRDLKSSPNNGLVKSNIFSRLANFIPGLDRKRIVVRNTPHGTEDTVLYCPDTSHCKETHANPTQFVRIDPSKAENLVYRGDEFEVTFLGMSATPHDTSKANNNELLLYSLLHEELCDEVCRKEQARSSSSQPDVVTSSEEVKVPTGIPQSSDVPFIHYDPVIDGHDKGAKPDSFVPIPASKRVYYRQKNSRHGDENCEQLLNVRFTIMEIDKISDILARAPANVDQLGSYVSKTAGQVPYIELVSKAISFASELGKHGLKEYAKPDHVLSTDAEFLLAEPQGGLSQKDGDYLRYGYYFFLSKPVDAQLYAQTCSSSQHMPLMLKREGLTLKRARQNEKLFFPLTGVSYLVMKVSKGCKNHTFRHSRSIHDEHRKRLDNMLEMRGVLAMLAGVGGKTSRRAARK